MDRSQTFERFDFYDQPPFDQQINAKSIGYRQPVIRGADSHLSLNMVAAIGELIRQKRFINRFKQTGSDITMDFEACIHRSGGAGFNMPVQINI